MFFDLKEELYCSVCLNLYVEPVTLRCGHSFCDQCIQQVLDSQESSGAYSCPHCRKRFTSRPYPHKTTTLCNVVKHFQASSPEHSADDIFCTYCIQTPVLAVKSCLLCEASLCTSHLSVHSKSPEHVVVTPTKFSQIRRCSVHSKVLDYFSPEDASCVYCSAHRSRHGRPEAEPRESQSMREILEKLTLERKTLVDRIQSLLLYRQEVQETADSYTRYTRDLFGELKKSLSALEKRVLHEILRQEEQVSFSVNDLIKQQEEKKHDVSKQIACITEISNMSGSSPVLESEVNGLRSFEDEGTNSEHQMLEEKLSVNKFIPVLISETLQRDLHDIITSTKPLYAGSEAVDILLDADTAGRDVVVSRDQKTVSWSRIKREHMKNVMRFQVCNQVLSTRSFSSGKYYWEIETCDNLIWRIGVAYPSIDRRNLKSKIGDNEKSWCLCRYKTEYSVRHDHKKTQLSLKVLAPRFGVYLDSWAGTLSFYELGDPIEQLYTFTATFSEPLHAAFYLGGKGCLRIRGTH